MFTMQIRLTVKQIKDMDALVKGNEYSSRSEFIRDAVRHRLESLNREGGA